MNDGCDIVIAAEGRPLANFRKKTTQVTISALRQVVTPFKRTYAGQLF